MFKVKHLSTFFMATLLLALLSCNNENAASSATQVDSLTSPAPNSSIVPSDTTTAQIVEEEEIDDEPDDVRGFDFIGDYVGKDPNIKLELGGSGFQYFEGSQVKMKGGVTIWIVKPNSLIIALQPFGENKKVTEVLMGLDGHDNAQWVIWQADTLFRKPVVYP